MTKPIYTLSTTPSKIQSWKRPEGDAWFSEVAEEFGSGHGILWLHNGIYLFEVSEGNVTWLKQPAVNIEKNAVRLRIFDHNKELHIWSSSRGLEGRWRWDNAGEDTSYVVCNQELRGVVAEQLFSKATTGKTVMLLTRQYIGFEDDQAVYVDMRCCGYDIL